MVVGKYMYIIMYVQTYNGCVLRKPMHPQSFMLIYGFLFELWVLNLNEKEEEEEKKKMNNSAHHSPIHLWWGGPWPSLYTKHYCALWYNRSIFLHDTWRLRKLSTTGKQMPSSICLLTPKPYLSKIWPCLLANLSKVLHKLEYLNPWWTSRSVSLRCLNVKQE